MSTDQPYMSPEGMQPYKKPGMSTGAKVLIILGILFLLLVLLCCCSGGAFIWWGASSFSEDPQVVREVTAEIVDIDVPENIEPKVSMDLKVPISGQKIMVMVVYADEATGSAVMLASFGEAFAGQGEQQMRDQMEQSLRQQGYAQDDSFGEREFSEKEIEVRGEPVTFTFATSSDPESGKQRIEVIGAFEGKAGPVMIMVFADPEQLSEEEIVEMIESIE